MKKNVAEYDTAIYTTIYTIFKTKMRQITSKFYDDLNNFADIQP